MAHGLVIEDCPCLAKTLAIFKKYILPLFLPSKIWLLTTTLRFWQRMQRILSYIMYSVMCIVTYLNSKFIPFILQKNEVNAPKQSIWRSFWKYKCLHISAHSGQKGAVINWAWKIETGYLLLRIHNSYQLIRYTHGR